MPNKKYNSKWAISYRGKNYLFIYGKKKAYDLLIRLNSSLIGLMVVRVEHREEKNSKEKSKYYRFWRAKNKEKVKEYNRRNYLKRKIIQRNGRNNDKTKT